jgi:hypothetical protein
MATCQTAELELLTEVSVGCASQPKSSAQCIRAGQEAWRRLSSSQSWDDWCLVSKALDIGRTEAMRAAHTNVPEGQRYCAEYSLWLKRNNFDGIDKGLRSRLFECRAHRPAIERWRATLPLSDRLKLNHPQAVLRRWKAVQKPHDDTVKKPSHVAKLNAALIQSQEENAQLRRDAERSGACDRWTPESSADQVADVIVGTFRTWKARAIAQAINRRLREKG